MIGYKMMTRGRIGPRAAYDDQRNDRAIVTYTVRGGERYRLKEVQFIGNTVISSEALRRAFAMADGDWFEREEIERWKKKKSLLLLQGPWLCRRALALVKTASLILKNVK